MATVLERIKVIWISHKHADHHLGTIGLLSHRARLCPQAAPVLVIAPHRVLHFLKRYAEIAHADSMCFDMMDIKDTCIQHHHEASRNLKQLDEILAKRCAGIVSLRSVSVVHCSGSFGVSLSMSSSAHSNGAITVDRPRNDDGDGIVKLVYSGDTRPCDGLVELGMDADILVHEATFDDDLSEDAVDKKHSTTSEALHIGRRMNAKQILLTHFSQRYPKIAKLASHSCIAFDLLRVRLHELERLESHIPLLSNLLSDEAKQDILNINTSLESTDNMTSISNAKELLASSDETTASPDISDAVAAFAVQER